MDQSAQNQQTTPSQQTVQKVIQEQTIDANKVSSSETNKQPENLTGSSAKEVAPTTSGVNNTSEVVKPTETEPIIVSELKEAGVKVTPNLNQPVIPKEVKEIVTPVKTAVPVSTEPTGLIQLPFDETKAKEIAKKSNVTQSIKWLAMLIVEQAQKTHAQFMKKNK